MGSFVLFYLCLLGTLFVGTSRPAPPARVAANMQQKPFHFSIQDTLAKEAKRLADTQVVCKKWIKLNGVEETLEVVQDSAAWMRGWSHLQALHLSPTVLHTAYKKSYSYQQGRTSIDYQLVPNQSLPVAAFSLVWDDVGSMVELRGRLVDGGYFSQHMSQVHAHFTYATDRLHLQTYELQGYQYLFGQDTLHYHVIWRFL